ncbi:MAG TPA: hypothetical protein VII20_19815 [Roseiarcus sp.]|jgi:hypothetical protein
MTQISTQGAMVGSRDAAPGAPLYGRSKRRHMLPAGLILIAVIAPPGAGAAYGGSSLIRRTADIRKEQIVVREKYRDYVNTLDIKGVGLVEVIGASPF